MTDTELHHHHWVLVDGFCSVYDCACGATRGDRNPKPQERRAQVRRRHPRLRARRLSLKRA